MKQLHECPPHPMCRWLTCFNRKRPRHRSTTTRSSTRIQRAAPAKVVRSKVNPLAGESNDRTPASLNKTSASCTWGVVPIYPLQEPGVQIPRSKSKPPTRGYLKTDASKLSCSVTLEKSEPFLGKTIFSGAATKKRGATEQLSKESHASFQIRWVFEKMASKTGFRLASCV